MIAPPAAIRITQKALVPQHVQRTLGILAFEVQRHAHSLLAGTGMRLR